MMEKAPYEVIFLFHPFQRLAQLLAQGADIFKDFISQQDVFEIIPYLL